MSGGPAGLEDSPRGLEHKYDSPLTLSQFRQKSGKELIQCKCGIADTYGITMRRRRFGAIVKLLTSGNFNKRGKR